VFRREATRSAGWILSRGFAQALEFVAWVVFAWRLGASALGVLAVAAITSRLLGLIADWGATWRGPRDVAAHGKDSAIVVSLVRRRELVSVLLAVGMATVLGLMGDFALMPMAVVVGARGSNRDWIALGEARRLHSSVPLLVQGALIAMLAAALPPSIAAGAIAVSIGNLAGLAVSRRLNPVSFHGVLAKTSVSGWYLIAGIADQAIASADTALLLVLRSADEAGVYNTIYRLPLAWLTVVGLTVTAAVPIVTRISDRPDFDPVRLYKHADRAAIVAGLTVLPVANISLALLGPLLGEEFDAGRDAMLILFVAVAVTTMSAPYRVLVTAHGPDRLVGLVTLGLAILNGVGNVFVIPTWGMEGAAMTTLGGQLLLFGFLFGWSLKSRASLCAEMPNSARHTTDWTRC
jgi:O-antigen/teichoic acid export membrane protein